MSRRNFCGEYVGLQWQKAKREGLHRYKVAVGFFAVAVGKEMNDSVYVLFYYCVCLMIINKITLGAHGRKDQPIR